MPWLHSAGVCCSPHLQRGQLTAHRRAVSTAVACILFLLFYFPEIPFVVWTPFHLGAVSFAGGVQCRPTAPSPPHSSSFAWIQWLPTSPASPASSRQAPVSSLGRFRLMEFLPPSQPRRPSLHVPLPRTVAAVPRLSLLRR
uniref:Uncharacterized protein n=1 Tax=Triticum urartu TaxID=4572 RepID=A0A8R7UU17_TRIUA